MWVGLTITRAFRGLVVALAMGLALSALGGTQWDECRAPLAAFRAGSAHAYKVFLHRRVEHANGEFINEAVNPSGRYRFFFHMENAVVKSLNDRYFRDKELTAATVAHFKALLLEALRAEGVESPLIYSDYKILRLGFERDTVELRRALSRAMDAAGDRFVDELARYPGLQSLVQARDGIVGSPRYWHLGGWGVGPEEAALAARASRDQHPNIRGRVVISDFAADGLNATTVGVAREAEILRRRVTEALEGRALDLLQGPAGGRLPSVALLDLIRKLPEDGVPRPQLLREGFLLRFGTRLTESEAKDLLAYCDLAQRVAPSVLESAEVTGFALDHAVHGLVAADLSGQNSRNLQGVMGALHGARDLSDGHAILQALRREQHRQSERFVERRERFRRALRQMGLKGLPVEGFPDGLAQSGDDAAFFPSAPLGLRDKENLLSVVASVAQSAGDFRLTFVPDKYSDGQLVSEGRRSELVTLGETTEKALRLQLERLGVIQLQQGRWTFGVDVDPHRMGGGSLRLIVAGNLTAGDRAKVERAWRTVLPSQYQSLRTRWVPVGSALGWSMPPTD